MLISLFRGLSVILLLLLSSPGIAQAGQDRFDRTAKLELLKKRLAYYNHLYPEIHFAHLQGGQDWRSEMVAVFSLLGDKATYLDYQHPPELRSEMFNVSLSRLARMLENDIVSASLYRVDKNSPLDRPNICLITLNPETFANNARDATHYMLDLTDEQMGFLHPVRLLDARQHWQFTIDHEAYHCIDSYLNGGSPMTKKWFGGEYHLFQRESAADAYALAMHLRRHGGTTEYARNITHIRALWLFTDSPNRCTFESMLNTFNTDIEELLAMSNDEILAYVRRVRDHAVGSYDFYIRQRASAYKAARRLGLNPKLYGEVWQRLEKVETDPREVEYRIDRYRYYYNRLFTDEQVDFMPADVGLDVNVP